jgi:hypothetical protein
VKGSLQSVDLLKHRIMLMSTGGKVSQGATEGG